jgi:hypothetical protein
MVRDYVNLFPRATMDDVDGDAIQSFNNRRWGSPATICDELSRLVARA